MNRIVEILMKRDNLSYDDAQDWFDEVKEEADQMMEDECSFIALESLLADEFSLEPDYLFDLIEL